MSLYQLTVPGHTFISLDGTSPKVKVVEGEVVDITNPEMTTGRLFIGGFRSFNENSNENTGDSEKEKTSDDYTANELKDQLKELGIEDLSGKKELLFARIQEAKAKKASENVEKNKEEIIGDSEKEKTSDTEVKKEEGSGETKADPEEKKLNPEENA